MKINKKKMDATENNLFYQLTTLSYPNGDNTYSSTSLSTCLFSSYSLLLLFRRQRHFIRSPEVCKDDQHTKGKHTKRQTDREGHGQRGGEGLERVWKGKGRCRGMDVREGDKNGREWMKREMERGEKYRKEGIGREEKEREEVR